MTKKQFSWTTLLVLIVSIYYVQSELLFTIWIARHGAREPFQLSRDIVPPNDQLSHGLRVLTNVGTRQQYFLGRYFHEMYKDDFDVSPSTVHIRATVCARTMMSAGAFIRGLTFGKMEADDSIQTVPKTPFDVDEKAFRKYLETYPEISKSRFVVATIVREDDYLSSSYSELVCPNAKNVKEPFMKSKKRDKIMKRGVKIVSPIVAKAYGAIPEKRQKLVRKVENLLYAKYYNLADEIPLSDSEGTALSEAKEILKLGRGLFLPEVVRLACHNFFSQMQVMFDFAIQRARLAPHQFEALAPDYHRKFVQRDKAYFSHLRFFELNPKEFTKLKGVVYQNHDDFIYMIMRAISDLNPEEIKTPFASLLVFELHKDDHAADKYFVKIRFDNNSELKLRNCEDPLNCPLKTFLETIQYRGMFRDDSEFKAMCGLSKK